MVYTYKDVDLLDKLKLYVALRRIPGIGLRRAAYLCDTVGISFLSRTEDINEFVFLFLIFVLKQYYGTDIFLKRIRENNLKEFLSFKSYKSIRFAAGLPIRGQHTHNNAKTAKRLHRAVLKK
jgi:small subunit ribosomal protein S13